MKKIAFLLFIGFLGISLNAQEKTVTKEVDENAPVFKFEKEVIDYGEVEQNSDGKRVFKFKNTGKSPLIIANIKSSCGCTVPSRPKEPIMPGASAEIEVKYATNRVGPFSKRITVMSNASEPTKVLTIKGRVKKESALSILERKEKSMIENNN